MHTQTETYSVRTYKRYVQLRRRNFEPQRRRACRASRLTVVHTTAPFYCVAAHKVCDITSERYLSIRRPSVAPCGAVPWVPSNNAQRGNGIGETHEKGGKLHLVSGKRGYLFRGVPTHSIKCAVEKAVCSKPSSLPDAQISRFSHSSNLKERL